MGKPIVSQAEAYAFALTRLTGIRAEIRNAFDRGEGDIDQAVDVRLVCEESGSLGWCDGDAQYDSRHSPYCASNVIDGATNNATMRDIARSLVSELLDAIDEDAFEDSEGED